MLICFLADGLAGGTTNSFPHRLFTSLPNSTGNALSIFASCIFSIFDKLYELSDNRTFIAFIVSTLALVILSVLVYLFSRRISRWSKFVLNALLEYNFLNTESFNTALRLSLIHI